VPTAHEVKSGSESSQLRGSAVERAAETIRGMILSRDLYPGQPLVQDELSERIGISRGPTREALRALSKEGIISYTPNRGYAVSRFDMSEMTQMYTLRDLAESEVLRTLPPPTPAQLARLREINEQIKNPDATIEEAMRLNRDFHFTIFDASPKKLIVREIDRWWNMSSFYRSMGIGIWGERARMMGAAHDAQIDAWAAPDNDRLVELCRDHRWVSLERLSSFI